MAAMIKAGRKIPWAKVLIAAKFVYERAQDNLTKAERNELGTLLKKTKGRSGNLSARDRTRMRNLAYKAATGKKR